jgi:hypothetical protein
MARNARPIVSFLLFSAAVAGCQGSADVKIAFDHTAGPARALTLASSGQTPTVFGVKIVAAYLAEDEDQAMQNVGNVGRIWVNPICDAELHHCGIGPGAGANRVTDYFDLALPTEEVNARLNAQAHSIPPGTYRLLRLDLAGLNGVYDRDVANMQYGMAGETPSQVRRDNVYVARLDPPLVLADGDSVTMSLGYDIQDHYFAQPDGTQPPEGVTYQDWYCQTDTHGPCLQFSGFKPSVTRHGAITP